jgi:hypothetical protein
VFSSTTSDRAEIAFSAITASKVFNVSIGGFNDIDGNAVTTFISPTPPSGR